MLQVELTVDPQGSSMDPIRSIYEDDPDMLEIVLEFAAELPQRVEELRSRMTEGDMAQLQVLAHQLKGAGGGYGFQQISDLAASLEQSLKEGADESTVKDRYQALCETLCAVEVPEQA